MAEVTLHTTLSSKQFTEKIPLIGDYGRIYKCLDEQTKKYLVIKEIQITNNNNNVKEALKSLEHEIDIYSKLSTHPNIVAYYGTIAVEGSIILVMDYMDKGSLRAVLDQLGSLPASDIAWFTRNILVGLKFLHDHNIIHRNIKTANVLLGSGDAVKLCDYGTCRYIEIISSKPFHKLINGTERAMEGRSSGSPLWTAPEIIRCEPCTFAADVWSIGITMVEMLSVNPPYYDLEVNQAILKIGNAKKIDYTAHEETPKELVSFIDTVGNCNPLERPNVESLLESEFIIKFARRDLFA